MRYAILSDAHSNPAALETALSDARDCGCRRFVFLGDITGYGYDARTALGIVRRNFDIVLMGNHDSACAGLESAWTVMTNPNYDIDRAQRDFLEGDDIKWLRALPYDFSCKYFAASHGDFVQPKSWNYILSTELAIPNFFARTERLMFCGHTHHVAIWEATEKGVFRGKLENRFAMPTAKPESVSFTLKAGSRYIVNVGSVGYPRVDLCMSYAMFDTETKRVTIRRLPFAFDKYIESMRSSGTPLPAWLRHLMERVK